MAQLLESGQTLLFLGDSITDCSRDREDPGSLGEGYAAKVAQVFRALWPGRQVTFLNRGVSGDRSGDVLAKYRQENSGIQADVVSVLVGINDVWRIYDAGLPTTKEAYRDNVRALLEEIRRSNPACRILVMEPFLLNTDPDKLVWRRELDPMIQELRGVARELADYYLPLDGILSGYAAAGYPDRSLSEDAVHPTQVGHGLIAREYLKLLGLL